MDGKRRTLDDLVCDGETIDRALRDGVRAALVRHAKLGQSIVVWRDGRVAIVPPEEIEPLLSAADGNGDGNGES